MTASTLADMYAAVTSACGTLKGPLHGGANEESIYMLNEIATPDRAEAWLQDALAKKAKVMGFGHRVYKSGDSRVPIMREIARDLGKRLGKEQWVPICENLEATMEREKQLCANVDLYAAPVFTMLKFPPELKEQVTDNIAKLERVAQKEARRPEEPIACQCAVGACPFHAGNDGNHSEPGAE